MKLPDNDMGLASAHIIILYVLTAAPDASQRKVILPRREGINQPWAGAGNGQRAGAPPPKNVDRLISEYVDRLRYIR